MTGITQQPNSFDKEEIKGSSISESQEEGTIIETYTYTTNQEEFVGNGDFGEGHEDVNVEGLISYY
jgi:hypothetical protein